MHVLVTKEFLESVEKNISSLRPAWRVDAARVDTHCDFGLLMSDHSIFAHGIETHIIGLASSGYDFSVFHLN